MKILLIWKFYFFILFQVLFLSCQEELNFYNPTISKSQWEDYQVHLALGQAYYDRSEIDEALIHAEKAVALNSSSEAAAILLGYVYLAKTGLLPISLLQQMMIDENSEASNTDELSDKEENQEEEVEESDSLSELNMLIGLTDEELSLMGTLNYDVPSLPVIEPICAEEARDVVEALSYMKKAVLAICSFVDKDVLIQGDPRHECDSNLVNKSRQVEAHFLWGLSHLVEAIAFNNIVNYKTGDNSKSNLELRIENLQNLDVSSLNDIASLVEGVTSMTTLIDNVLQLDGVCKQDSPQTQFFAMINDLMTVTLAFSKVPGIPEDVLLSINAAIEQINSFKEKSSEIAEKQQEFDNSKNSMQSKMASAIGTAIDKVKKEDYTSEQIAEVCSAYASVGESSSESVSEKPLACM